MAAAAPDNAMAATAVPEKEATGHHDRDDGAAAEMVKMVEMPVPYLRWVLAQSKDDYRVPTLEDYTEEELDHAGRETVRAAIASLEAAYDEFANFTAWVRGVLEEDGVVMISPDMLFSDPKEWQESVDQEWAGARKELAELETTGGGPLGPHLYMLSVYLALTYKYAAPIPTFWDA